MAAAWLVRTIERAQERAGQGGDAPARMSLWERIRRTPLVLPTLVMIVVYLISTVLSRTPRISWWGSYVRLQGTYTVYSYILVFFFMLGTLRKRAQVDRIIHTVILTSVPASLYGILQHYGLDPLPWAGSVQERVASTMGNAIFIAAYLLMAAFLTMYRLVVSFVRLVSDKASDTGDALLAGVYLFVLAVQCVAIFFSQSRGPWLGLGAGLFVFALIGLVGLRQMRGAARGVTLGEVARGVGLGAGALIVAGLLAVVALREIQSPLLGLGLLGLTLLAPYVVLIVRRSGLQWLWITLVTQAVLVAGFLVVFNLPGTPLASLKSLPYIGRLGQIFETEGGTGKVRVLIWEGAARMVVADPVRTIIGYGPESMYVTYEPFYPPDLAHYEERNRTPDRSHNQTFDTLISTGVLGFAAYMFLFGSVFYLGLRWLGLLRSGLDNYLFIGLIAGSSLLSVAVERLITGSFALAGVSLPAGFVLGLAVYLVIAAARRQGPKVLAGMFEQRLLLTALMAAALGHFVEIHFGFDIASTATYFWVFIALFSLVGMGRLTDRRMEPSAAPVAAQPVASRKRRKQSERHPASVARHEPARTMNVRWVVLLSFALVAAIVVGTIMYDFTSAQLRETTAGEIVQHSFFSIVNTANRTATSTVGTPAMLLLTILVGGIIAVKGAIDADENRGGGTWWIGAAAVYAVVAVVPGWIIATLRADILRARTTLTDISGMVPMFYVTLLLLLALLALALARTGSWPRKALRSVTWLAYPVILIVALFGVWAFNLTTVRADIQYQQGFLLEQDYSRQAGSLDNARRLTVLNSVLGFYKQAIANAPDEDFYYLASARIYQQMAPLTSDAAQKNQIYEEGLQVVQEAKALYPLNVDHTANLGRLYRSWAQETSDPAVRAERLALADKYYAEATTLSPNKAHLENEWAVVKFAQGDNAGALQKLQKAEALDSQYDSTFILLAEYYARSGEWDKSAESIDKALTASQFKLESYNQYFALESLFEQLGRLDLSEKTLQAILTLTPQSVEAESLLGYVLSKTGRYTEAVTANLQVLQWSPNDFVSTANLAFLYDALQQPDSAFKYAQAAVSLTTKTPKPPQATVDKMLPDLNSLIARLQGTAAPK
jgi:tetratricopeptide (TPR) repeat protein/O-antigen ligase